MISNHADQAEVAEWFGVDFVHLPVTADTKPAQEAAVQAALAEHGVTLVVLARYMQILSADFVRPVARRHHQHPPFVPARVHGRSPVPPGARAGREDRRGHRALRDRRARRRPDHRPGRRARQPPRLGRGPAAPRPRPRGRRARPRACAPTSSTACSSTAAAPSSSTEQGQPASTRKMPSAERQPRRGSPSSAWPKRRHRLRGDAGVLHGDAAVGRRGRARGPRQSHVSLNR